MCQFKAVAHLCVFRIFLQIQYTQENTTKPHLLTVTKPFIQHYIEPKSFGGG